MRTPIFLLLTAAIFTFLLEGVNAADNSKKKAARQSLLNDPDLTMFVPFDQSIEPENWPQGRNPTAEPTGNFETGIFGQALSTGAERFQALYPLDQEISLKAGTVMFWFKPGWSGGDPSGKYTLLWLRLKDTQGQPANLYFAIHRSFNKDEPLLLFFALGFENGLKIDPAKYFIQGQWVHIAMTWDSQNNEFVVYADGQRISDAQWKDYSDQFTPYQLLLGQFYGGEGGDDPINASYDDLLVFKRALSGEEIQAYFDDQTGRNK